VVPLTETLPEDLQDKLPDIKELAARLEEVAEEDSSPNIDT
jgi:hypothetical protein